MPTSPERETSSYFTAAVCKVSEYVSLIWLFWFQNEWSQTNWMDLKCISEWPWRDLPNEPIRSRCSKLWSYSNNGLLTVATEGRKIPMSQQLRRLGQTLLHIDIQLLQLFYAIILVPEVFWDPAENNQTMIFPAFTWRLAAWTATYTVITRYSNLWLSKRRGGERHSVHVYNDHFPKFST